MSLKSDWSYSEEETDFKKQNEAEEEIEECNSNIQKLRELEEQELENNI